MLRRPASVFRGAALCLYLAALVTVPFQTRDPMNAWGIEILLVGWIALADGNIAWLANPLLIFALLSMDRQPRASLAACGLAVLVSLDALRAMGLSLGFDSSRDIFGGEIQGLGPGAYAWYGSLVAALVACVLHRRATSSLR